MFIKHKKKIIVGVIGLAIICIVLALVNFTYALFSTDVYGTNTNAYTTGMLSIEASSKSDNVSLSSALPMTDEEGLSTNPYVFTIKNVGNLDYLFDIKLLSTGDSSTSFSAQYIKLQIDDGEVTTLSALTNGEIRSDVTLRAGESIDVSIRVWLSIDTPNSEIGKSFNSKIVTDGQAVYTSSNNEFTGPTLLTDFVYVLGSETSVVDVLTLDGVDVRFPSIELDSNEVLLVDYVGTSTDVNIPDTYTVDGITYNVTILSCNQYVKYSSITYNYESIYTGVFYGNDYIESVFFGDNVKFLYGSYDEEGISFGYEPSYAENSADHLFYNCTNLRSVNIIPGSVTNMSYTFYGCTSLVNAPEIPNSVTNMYSTFYGCTSLVYVPEIPSTVTNMSYTFNGCISLVNAPVLPTSVTSMSGTFKGCSSLVTAPEIPGSVTSMQYTFYGCTSLVNAPEIPTSVTNMNYTFSGCTSLVNAPVLPTSVTSMYETFKECTSLVNAPEIPSSVTDMYGTFQGCTSLVNAPEIPSSVTNMNYTFTGCTSLVNAPVIPASVSYIAYTFSDCINLTGTVRINSSKISNYHYIFHNTSKAIIVEVPAGSTTYTKISALTTSNGMPSNVTLITY